MRYRELAAMFKKNFEKFNITDENIIKGGPIL